LYCAGAGVLYLQPSCVCRRGHGCRLETGQGAGSLDSYLRMLWLSSRWPQIMAHSWLAVLVSTGADDGRARGHAHHLILMPCVSSLWTYYRKMAAHGDSIQNIWMHSCRCEIGMTVTSHTEWINLQGKNKLLNCISCCVPKYLRNQNYLALFWCPVICVFVQCTNCVILSCWHCLMSLISCYSVEWVSEHWVS